MVIISGVPFFRIFTVFITAGYYLNRFLTKQQILVLFRQSIAEKYNCYRFIALILGNTVLSWDISKDSSLRASVDIPKIGNTREYQM